VVLLLQAAPAHAVANPAAVFCVESGGRYEMRQEANGTRGMCILPDGEPIDAWKHFRREQGQPAQQRPAGGLIALDRSDRREAHSTAAASDQRVMKNRIREPGVHSMARMSWVWAVR